MNKAQKVRRFSQVITGNKLKTPPGYLKIQDSNFIALFLLIPKLGSTFHSRQPSVPPSPSTITFCPRGTVWACVSVPWLGVSSLGQAVSYLSSDPRAGV